MKRSFVVVLAASSLATGCIRTTASDPSVAPPTTATTTSTSTTTTSTTTSTTTTTVPLTEFATGLVDGERQSTPSWRFDQPAASRVSVTGDLVAVASYSDGRRWDSVLSLSTGEKQWGLVSTDSAASGPSHDIAPLIIDGGYVHLERFGISDGATIQSIEVDTGAVRWAEDQPRWFEAPPWQCGEQRICAVTWDTYEGARRIIQLDSTDGRLVAQGPILGTEILGDVRLVTDPNGPERAPYPEPPATIPGEQPPPPPEETAPPTDTEATAPPASPPPATPPPSTTPDGASGFRSPQVTPVESEPIVARFDPTGKRLWQFPLSDLLPTAGVAYATPFGQLDVASNTFVIASPAGAVQPGEDVVIGIDYDTGERLWTAKKRSFDCWEWMVRPANVRCHVKGSIQTVVDDEGAVSLVSNSAIKVTFEAFDPRSGDVLGEVTASYPAWDGQGNRPFVPSATWLIAGGLAIESTDGLVGLSTADGEVVPIESTITGWCQNPPVDDDGEVFPGYYPCTVGEPTRTRTEGVAPAMVGTVGAVSGDTAVYVTEGYVNAYQLGR